MIKIIIIVIIVTTNHKKCKKNLSQFIFNFPRLPTGEPRWRAAMSTTSMLLT